MSKTNKIVTFKGYYINPLDPDPDMVDIEDIAHSLSNQCRFGGHIHTFKSIAEHCIEVSSMVGSKYKLEGLLHDAAEYLLLDIPSPVKRQIPQYIRAEKIIMKIISKKFGIPETKSEEVSLIDKWVQNREIETFFIERSDISCLTPKEAESIFLEEYYRLTDKSVSKNKDQTFRLSI